MRTYFSELFTYEEWANCRVLEAFLQVKNPPERAVQLMSHMLAAQQIWYNRLTQQVVPINVWGVFPSEQLLELMTENAQKFRAFINTLPNDSFDAVISYTNTKGEPFTSTIRQILTHLQLHAAYHRGQIIQLLKPHFADPIPTDYIFYVRESGI